MTGPAPASASGPASGPSSGYVYVADADPGRMAGAEAGRRVANPDPEPPYIVATRSLGGLTVWNWPGRLFRVEVVPPEDERWRERIDRANAELVPEAGYTRAMSVDVVAELPVSALFGPHGERVAEVIEATRGLTQERAERLASARHPGAGEAYSAAWDRWLAAQPNPGPYLGTPHEGVTAIPGARAIGTAASPVGSGFTAVYRMAWLAARSRGRPGIAVVVEDGETEEYFEPPWRRAFLAAVEAAMAFGAPHLVEGGEAGVLTAAWDAAVTGDR
ncbi:hypothetical protein [Actinomadura rugatobispora]|uniref:Uncharacterized protein n=1 Tax=Actinomadura rugatobispora TaxID=1994 RepID=A0ABW1AFY4_9ACTN|nr:hypothetical protein GCM10010200_104970 [Actinomadura rugatobispora]